MKEEQKKIEEERKRWEEKTLKPALERFKLKESPTSFYSPQDLGGIRFLEQGGLSGSISLYRRDVSDGPLSYRRKRIGGDCPGARAGSGRALLRVRDRGRYPRLLSAHEEVGQQAGPNIAFDLPTQCGYDSDSPMASGEVGRVGVSIDTLRDMEVVYEAFTGERDLDRMASNFTINAPADMIMAMYLALAQKRGIGWEKLRATPQNDILKEYVARGTYIFPPRSAMRLFRDSLIFFTKHLPNVNITSIGGYHIREAAATREQDLAFSMAIGAAYLQEGVNARLAVDAFAPRFSFNAFGGGMEFFKEIAFHRAARRMWARLLKERFGARNPRSMTLRLALSAFPGNFNCTVQRPLNNLVRSVVGGIAAALAGGAPNCSPPYDEPLGLGWSLELLRGRC